MLKIKVEKVSRSRVMVDRKSLLALIRKVRKLEKVELKETSSDIPAEGIMRLAEKGGALDFLYGEKENIYSISDVKIRYR